MREPPHYHRLSMLELGLNLDLSAGKLDESIIRAAKANVDLRYEGRASWTTYGSWIYWCISLQQQLMRVCGTCGVGPCSPVRFWFAWQWVLTIIPCSLPNLTSTYRTYSLALGALSDKISIRTMLQVYRSLAYLQDVSRHSTHGRYGSRRSHHIYRYDKTYVKQAAQKVRLAQLISWVVSLFNHATFSPDIITCTQTQLFTTSCLYWHSCFIGCGLD